MSELRNVHRQAVLAADKVYAGIKDTKQVLSGYHRAISEVMKQKVVLKNSLDGIHGEARQEVKQKIRAFNELLTQHYAEKDALKASVDDMYLQLKKLNQNTGRLKQQLRQHQARLS